MEQRIIKKTEEKCIYFMKENNLDFYFVIPNNKQVSIVLGLFSNVNDEFIETINFEQDKAVIVPVISNQILTSANHLDTTGFKYLDSVLSYLINVSYKILTSNNLIVNQKILINNNPTYTNFNQKYVEKYGGRVELYELIKKEVQKPINNDPIFEPREEVESVNNFKPVEPPFKNYKPIDNEDEIKESIEPLLYDEPVITTEETENRKEPGFVSYVLLGVIIAVISLVILYKVL